MDRRRSGDLALAVLRPTHHGFACGLDFVRPADAGRVWRGVCKILVLIGDAEEGFGKRIQRLFALDLACFPVCLKETISMIVEPEPV